MTEEEQKHFDRINLDNITLSLKEHKKIIDGAYGAIELANKINKELTEQLARARYLNELATEQLKENQLKYNKAEGARVAYKDKAEDAEKKASIYMAKLDEINDVIYNTNYKNMQNKLIKIRNILK